MDLDIEDTARDPENVDTELQIHLEVEELVAERVKREAEIEADRERIDAINARLLDLLPTGTHDAGDHKVTIRAGARRLDPAKVAEAYPFREHPEMYKVAVDTAKVREYVAPNFLRDLQTEGNPTVVVS